VRGDEQGAEPLVVRSTVSISDSQWHRVVCRRDGDGITISVDGSENEKRGATGSVTNDSPLRVGAPGVSEGDDQFHGRIDDVYLLVDSSG
jgi:Concanavalin A-like lectin/glucanases superfamily